LDLTHPRDLAKTNSAALDTNRVLPEYELRMERLVWLAFVALWFGPELLALAGLVGRVREDRPLWK
jgi:hypothetical protein